MCIRDRSITISEPELIVITPTVINASDETTADGSISVEVTGGTGPYTYMWSNGATTSTIENLPFGSYEVKVTDANGCMETITVVIDPNCTISVQLFPTEISCRGNDEISLQKHLATKEPLPTLGVMVKRAEVLLD